MPRTLLSSDTFYGILSVPGRAGRSVSVAVEEFRLALTNDDFAAYVTECNDMLHDIIDE